MGKLQRDREKQDGAARRQWCEITKRKQILTGNWLQRLNFVQLQEKKKITQQQLSIPVMAAMSHGVQCTFPECLRAFSSPSFKKQPVR